MEQREINFLVRKSIYDVHNELGPNLLESVYEEKLAKELQSHHLNIETQVVIPVKYGDHYVDLGLRANIIVENKIIIITKSVEKISKKDKIFFSFYLHSCNIQTGFLVNFNTYSIRKNTFRKVIKFKD